jgi:hypothetical protein
MPRWEKSTPTLKYKSKDYANSGDVTANREQHRNNGNNRDRFLEQQASRIAHLI